VKQATAKVISIGLEIEEDPLVPEGSYTAVMVNWKKTYSGYFKKHLLIMRFRIVDEGQCHGAVIPGYFNVLPSSKGQVKAARKSYFFRDYQACFGKVERNDRLAMTHFKNRLLKVQVMTVSKDADQMTLAEVNHYSRVKHILGLVE